MVKLNIDQQVEEVRDIEDFIKDLSPISLVELQSQQVRRLIYFSKKGIQASKSYKARMNPAIAAEINVNDGEQP